MPGGGGPSLPHSLNERKKETCVYTCIYIYTYIYIYTHRHAMTRQRVRKVLLFAVYFKNVCEILGHVASLTSH